MPRIPLNKAGISHIKNVAGRTRPAAGTKRALAEAKAAAGRRPLPSLKPHQLKLALPPPRDFTTPGGKTVIVK